VSAEEIGTFSLLFIRLIPSKISNTLGLLFDDTQRSSLQCLLANLMPAGASCTPKSLTS